MTNEQVQSVAQDLEAQSVDSSEKGLILIGFGYENFAISFDSGQTDDHAGDGVGPVQCQPDQPLHARLNAG